MDMPSDEVMKMLSQEAMRQAMATVSKHLRQFAAMPGMDKVSGRDALISAADAMLTTNDTVWGMKQ